MTKLYESPKSDVDGEPVPSARRPRALQTVAFGFGGAFLGYMVLTILANIEAWRFYTIRSTLTGESAMSRIVAHPADRWIVLGLFISFVFGGAFMGFWIARRDARKRAYS